jgi:hypothetical protein
VTFPGRESLQIPGAPPLADVYVYLGPEFAEQKNVDISRRILATIEYILDHVLPPASFAVFLVAEGVFIYALYRVIARH